MKELFDYVDTRMEYAQNATTYHDRDRYFCQAFGAVDFFVRTNPASMEDAAIDRWENYRKEFTTLLITADH